MTSSSEKKLRSLRESDKLLLRNLKEQKERAMNEHSKKINEVDREITRLEYSIGVWNKMIEQLGAQSGSQGS